MQVILLENIKKLGAIGEKVTVKDGYARNFLLKNNDTTSIYFIHFISALFCWYHGRCTQS